MDPLSPLFKALKEGFQFLGTKLDAVRTAVNKSGDNLDLKGSVDKQTRALVGSLAKLDKAIDRIKEPKFTGEVRLDASAVAGEMRVILEEVRGLSDDLKKKMPDIGGIERGLAMLLTETKEQPWTDMLTSLDALKMALEGKELKLPKKFELEENQFRALANAGRSGGGSLGPLLARNVAQTNLALTATDTEYSFTFPANTLSWMIKLRDQGTLAYYAFATGTLPTVGGGGDGSKYSTIPQNFLRSMEGVEWGGKVIYLGAESATQVAEIEVYTA